MELKRMTVKRRDTEQWMSHRMLPENLKERTCRYERYKWQLTRGADEEHLLGKLPKDLRKAIKRHICLPLLMRVSGSMSYYYCCCCHSLSYHPPPMIAVILV